MGSLTLLFRQPVAALQVLTKDGTWKWVKPQTDALTVNIADALQFLTGQYSESQLWHRETQTRLTCTQAATSNRAFIGLLHRQKIKHILTVSGCCIW